VRGASDGSVPGLEQDPGPDAVRGRLPPGVTVVRSVCPSFYPSDEGTCDACPVRMSSWEQYKGLIWIFLAIILFVSSAFAIVYIIATCSDTSISSGTARFVSLGVWSLTTAQVFSQAAAVSTPTLPRFARIIYGVVAALQLQGLLLPPMCSGNYAFESEGHCLCDRPFP